jgi:hypothetical protein
MMAEQAAKNGLIPTGGYFVGIDFYVNNPTSPGKTQRARVPFDAVVWLLQRLEAQGITQEAMSQVDPTQRAAIQQQVNAGSLPPANQAGGVSQNGMTNQSMPPMADQAGSPML